MPSEQNPFGFGETYATEIDLPKIDNLIPTYQYVDEKSNDKEDNAVHGDAPVTDNDANGVHATTEHTEGVGVVEGIEAPPVSSSIPEWVGEAWVPPVDADVSWYKDKYTEALAYPSSPEFQEQLLNTMKDSIVAAQDDAERIAETARALLNGDTKYLRQFFPEKLQEIGVEPILSKDEIGTLIKQQLATEFGDDYESIFDQKHLLNPTSTSSQMQLRSQQLLAQFSNENVQRKDNFERYKQGQLEAVKQTEQQEQLSPDQLFDHVKDKMDRKTFDETLEYALQNQKDWTMADIRKIVTYDNDVKEAYEKGRAEALGQIRTIGNSKQIVPPTKEEKQYGYREVPSFSKMLGDLNRQQQ